MAKKTSRVLMCPPEHFTVEYEINPWMHTEVVVDDELATRQWDNLHQAVSRIQPDIQLIDPEPGLPDLVFIDAGFLYKNVFVPSNFRFPERQAEAEVFANWFADNGYEVRRIEPELYFEGHGDDLWLDNNTVYCGYGFRSQKVTFEHIRKVLDDVGRINMKFVELTDPRFYHLDTCFTPLKEDLAMIYPAAVSQDSFQELKKDLELIQVDDEDAFHFACNTIVLGDHLIMPAASKKLQEKLRAKGFHVHIVDVSEFTKSGGACKCMCMPLE